MTSPYSPHTPSPAESDDAPGIPPLMRGAMWVAIAALIAGAVLCVFWVLVSPEGGVIPKAFMTILALAGFAGTSLLDAQLAARRPSWLVVASMASWVLVLLCTLSLIWVPTGYVYPVAKVWFFILIVLFVQLTLLHQRLLWRAHRRHVTGFTRALTVVTSAFVLALLVMALVPLTLPTYFVYPEVYGRIMVSLAILGAVGTALVPIITTMFGPKRGAALAAARPLPWPTYRDGMTPLPILPDGQPDFEAQRTGVPSPGARSFAPAPQQQAHPQYAQQQAPHPQQSYPQGQPQQQYPQAPAQHQQPYSQGQPQQQAPPPVPQAPSHDPQPGQPPHPGPPPAQT